jgi:hypothetical protein
MGYGVMAYAVDDAMWGVIGSRSDELFELSARGSAQVAEFLDERLPTAYGAGTPPPAIEFLRHLVMGGPYDRRAGVAYGYWLKHLAESYGELLPNDCWVPAGTRFVDEVEAALVAAGVPTGRLSLSRLFFDGPPMELPPPDDFPGIGFMSRTDAPEAVRALDDADLSALPDPEILESVDQLRGWLSTCADSRRDLLCFYH